jgi:hypothetical protein
MIQSGKARAAALPQFKKWRELASSKNLMTYAWIAVPIFWILPSGFLKWNYLTWNSPPIQHSRYERTRGKDLDPLKLTSRA